MWDQPWDRPASCCSEEGSVSEAFHQRCDQCGVERVVDEHAYGSTRMLEVKVTLRLQDWYVLHFCSWECAEKYAHVKATPSDALV